MRTHFLTQPFSNTPGITFPGAEAVEMKALNGFLNTLVSSAAMDAKYKIIRVNRAYRNITTTKKVKHDKIQSKNQK